MVASQFRKEKSLPVIWFSISRAAKRVGLVIASSVLDRKGRSKAIPTRVSDQASQKACRGIVGPVPTRDPITAQLRLDLVQSSRA